MKGTEKQIAWAEDIKKAFDESRSTILVIIDEKIAERIAIDEKRKAAGKKVYTGAKEELENQKTAVIALAKLLEEKDDASAYIDLRDDLVLTKGDMIRNPLDYAQRLFHIYDRMTGYKLFN